LNAETGDQKTRGAVIPKEISLMQIYIKKKKKEKEKKHLSKRLLAEVEAKLVALVT
jgi:hypothetical protein